MEGDETSSQLLTNKMAIKLDVLGSLMHNRIANNAQGSWLSQYTRIGEEICSPKSPSKHNSQVTSSTVMRSALYSASAEDKETVCCYFVFQQRGLPLNEIKNPLTLLREEGQVAQSELEKTFKIIYEELVSKRPLAGSLTRYLKIWRAGIMCPVLGA